MVSSIEIAPTVLELASVAIPDSVDGRSFLQQLTGATHESRDFIFAEKNWHDFEDHARAVRDLRFKYIRNYYDDLPNTPPADAVRSATYETMKRRLEAGQLPESQQACFRKPRPPEELYDTESDPFEMHNLATDRRYRGELERFRKALADWEEQTGDAPPKLRTADEFDREAGTPTSARRRPRWSKKKMIAAGLTAG